MTTLRPRRLTQEVVLRVVADALMLNATLLIALALRLFYLVAFSHAPAELDYRLMRWASLEAYAHSSWALTLICLVVFALSGFYTYGRAYRGRYKALIIVQAVSLAYILFDCLAYFSGNLFSLSRPVLVLALLFSVGCLIASRLWALLWTKMVLVGRHPSARGVESAVRRVLVMGGGGYIGSALLPKLLDAGYHVRLLDLLLYSTEPIQDVLSHLDLEVIQADFRQVDRGRRGYAGRGCGDPPGGDCGRSGVCSG